jgi:hypothetical protein
MCKWLRSLLGHGQRKREKPEGQGPAEYALEGDAGSAAHGELDKTPPSLEREPVVVRGRAWYNAAAVERPTRHEPQSTAASSIESLAKKLMQDGRTMNRRSVAETLGKGLLLGNEGHSPASGSWGDGLSNLANGARCRQAD